MPRWAAPALEVCAATWSAVQGELRFQAAHCRASLVHAHSVWVRVDPEEHVALVHFLVVAHVELDDAAADVGRHVNQVGLQIGIVGAWPLIDPPRCENRRDQDTGQCDKADEDTQRLTNRRHRSVTEPEEPSEQRCGHRERDVG
jgi:hypothetical protein